MHCDDRELVCCTTHSECSHSAAEEEDEDEPESASASAHVIRPTQVWSTCSCLGWVSGTCLTSTRTNFGNARHSSSLLFLVGREISSLFLDKAALSTVDS